LAVAAIEAVPGLVQAAALDGMLITGLETVVIVVLHEFWQPLLPVTLKLTV
jgi:hypothetical protein